MAISYLSNINLNNNELKSFIVDNLAAAPTVNVADQGNLIYNTALGALQYNTGTNTWDLYLQHLQLLEKLLLLWMIMLLVILLVQ